MTNVSSTKIYAIETILKKKFDVELFNVSARIAPANQISRYDSKQYVIMDIRKYIAMRDMYTIYEDMTEIVESVGEGVPGSGDDPIFSQIPDLVIINDPTSDGNSTGAGVSPGSNDPSTLYGAAGSLAEFVGIDWYGELGGTGL